MRLSPVLTDRCSVWFSIRRAALIGILLSAGAQRLTAQMEAGRDFSTAAAGGPGDSVAIERTISAGPANVELPAWHSMVTNLPGDWARSARLTVQPVGLEAVAGIGFMTAALIATDGSTYDRTQTAFSHNGWLRSGADVIKYAGDGRSQLGVAAAFGMGGLIAGDARAIRTASQTLEGLLATGIVVQLLKHVTGRESPAQASADGGVWRFFPNLKAYQKNQAKYYAFPSGHIATTMTTVTIIAENYPELTWVRPVGYGLVGLVGVSLVGVKYHWYSDLPLGLAIGHLMGTVVAGRAASVDESNNAGKSTSLTLHPSVGPAGTGVCVALEF